MARFILTRMLQNIFVLFVLIAVMFFLFRLLPGDPIGVMASADLPPEARAALRAAWGLDRPLSVQFAAYVGNLLTGDFGISFAARNSLLPVATWVFHMFGYAIASTVLVEVVFAWPGLGREIVSAVTTFDYPVSQAAFFLISVITIGTNFLLDLLYGTLDPRVVASG